MDKNIAKTRLLDLYKIAISDGKIDKNEYRFIIDIAKSIGSVNTIVRKNNKLIGYNTDYNGIIDSLPNVKDKNILLVDSPLSARLNIYAIKQQIEDWAFKTALPKEFKYINEKKL